VPWRFLSVEEEYDKIRHGVGLIDYSTQAVITLEGADRVSFLQNLLTNDIKPLTPGQGCQAALLTPTARLLADVLVCADAHALWLLCDASRAAIVSQTLERYRFTEQVTISNHERQTAVLALQGPRTFEVLTQIIGTVIALPQPGDHTAVVMEGVTLRVIRHTLTGEVGVLCLCSAEDVARVWALFQERGLRFGLGLVGWEALNIARIEAGIPWYGIDMDESNLLPETGLETVAVSDTKGCYLGQEIIARMQTYGSANKKLMGVLMEGQQLPNPGVVITSAEPSTVQSIAAEPDTTVRVPGEELGRVTSACFSPTLKRPIALGYLKRGAYAPGTPVTIVHQGTRVHATVCSRPFIPHR
jgi:aminomethyltransferase